VQQFIRLLSSHDPYEPSFPPTEIYNEGWLLRLILDRFSDQGPIGYPLSFHTGARWFSEALVPSPFLPRFQSDSLAEAHTHADGVIGQFTIGRTGKADLELDAEATQLVILEAKINSPLSAGTTNAPDYDQAARNVACIAEVLRRSGANPGDVAELGFFVLAPREKINAGDFDAELDRSSIRSKVVARAAAYDGERDAWLVEWFHPLMEKITIDCLSWEEIIQQVGEDDPDAANSLSEFLGRCLEFN
jgi:hypothetical protein